MVNSKALRYQKKEEIVYKDLDKESLLYNPQTKAVHVLNKTSLMVWELCDGNHSLEMIEKKIKEKYEVSSGIDVRGDIEETIDKFSELGLVELLMVKASNLIMKEDIVSRLSIDVLEDLKASSTWSDEYCLFDINFTVKFDSPSEREHYFNNYRHFRVDSPEVCSGTCDIYYVISDASLVSKPLVIAETENINHLQEIFLHGSNQRRFKIDRLNHRESTCYAVTDTFFSNKPIMVVQEKACAILDSELWDSYAELIIFNSILSQIPNHCLLHAGVVSWLDKGIILCGSTKSGKSTFTLGLIQKDFKFLSDEVAFIDLATCEVSPFPRVLGFREDTLSKFPELKGLNGRGGAKSLSGDRKWAVDLEDIFPASLGRKCKIGYLIFLAGFSRDPELKPISKSEVLLESLKYSHTGEEDPFKHLLNFSDVVKDAECYKFVLGSDRDENVRVLEDLVARVDEKR